MSWSGVVLAIVFGALALRSAIYWGRRPFASPAIADHRWDQAGPPTGFLLQFPVATAESVDGSGHSLVQQRVSAGEPGA